MTYLESEKPEQAHFQEEEHELGGSNKLGLFQDYKKEESGNFFMWGKWDRLYPTPTSFSLMKTPEGNVVPGRIIDYVCSDEFSIIITESK